MTIKRKTKNILLRKLTFNRAKVKASARVRGQGLRKKEGPRVNLCWRPDISLERRDKETSVVDRGERGGIPFRNTRVEEEFFGRKRKQENGGEPRRDGQKRFDSIQGGPAAKQKG